MILVKGKLFDETLDRDDVLSEFHVSAQDRMTDAYVHRINPVIHMPKRARLAASWSQSAAVRNTKPTLPTLNCLTKPEPTDEDQRPLRQSREPD